MKAIPAERRKLTSRMSFPPKTGTKPAFAPSQQKMQRELKRSLGPDSSSTRKETSSQKLPKKLQRPNFPRGSTPKWRATMGNYPSPPPQGIPKRGGKRKQGTPGAASKIPGAGFKNRS